MNTYSTFLYQTMRLSAVLSILAGLLLPHLLLQYELYVAVVLMVLLGIPHGATDHLIFLNLSGSFLQARNLQRFYIHYLLLMLAYGLLWWFQPTVALAIFLGISMYHFGQSNWAYISFHQSYSKWVTYLLWGGFVLLTPILWHIGAATPIIEKMIGVSIPILDSGLRNGFLVFLFVANIGLSVYHFFRGRLSGVQLRAELLHLFLLGALFISTPLLLGFTVYFVFWHSFGSAADQVSFFKRHFKNYNWRRYALHTLPLSVVAIAGLGAMIWISNQWKLSVDIGLLFIFIAIVTLPHMILMDKLYQEWQLKTVSLDLKRKQL